MLFDEKDLRVFDNADSRNYFKEILQSYYSQNYRATIVLLYSFVIYDLFIKLQNMSNEGDKKAIKKYNPRTQEAMRMSIDWLKKYNDLVKARFAKDGAGVAAAKLEMDAYRDAMQTLDKNVWYVINDKMGPAFVEAGKANPTQDFDYSLVYRFLPKRYDSHIKAINVPEGQKQLNSVVQRQANEGR